MREGHRSASIRRVFQRSELHRDDDGDAETGDFLLGVRQKDRSDGKPEISVAWLVGLPVGPDLYTHIDLEQRDGRKTVAGRR